MRRFFMVLTTVICLGGVGCAVPATQTVTVGVPITDELIASIEQGKTTKSELIARLGRPATVVGMSNGTSVASWNYTQTERRGFKEGNTYFFGPLVMPVIDTWSLSVTFDEKDVVQLVTHASSHFGGAPVTVENKPLL